MNSFYSLYRAFVDDLLHELICSMKVDPQKVYSSCTVGAITLREPIISVSTADLRVYIARLQEDQSINPHLLFLSLPVTNYLRGICYQPDQRTCLSKGEYIGTAANSICFRVGYAVVKIFKSCVHLCGVRSDRVAQNIVTYIIQICRYANDFIRFVSNHPEMQGEYDIISNHGTYYSSIQLLRSYLCHQNIYDGIPYVCNANITTPLPEVVNTKHKYQILTASNDIIYVDIMRLAKMFNDISELMFQQGRKDSLVVVYDNVVNANLLTVYYISGVVRAKKRKHGSGGDANVVISNQKKKSLVSIEGHNKNYVEITQRIAWDVIVRYVAELQGIQHQSG